MNEDGENDAWGWPWLQYRSELFVTFCFCVCATFLHPFYVSLIHPRQGLILLYT